MKWHLSGWQGSNGKREEAVLKDGYLKYRCFSYSMLRKLKGLPYYLPGLQGSYDACRKYNVGIMLDSGVVSWRTHRNTLAKQGKTEALAKVIDEPEFVRGYVDYVKKHESEWEIYMGVDLARISAEIYERHCRTEAMGIRPCPVLHGDDDVDKYIGLYADRGYKTIALATARVLRTGQRQFRQYLQSIRLRIKHWRHPQLFQFLQGP